MMQQQPTEGELLQALVAAGQAHHEYEQNALGGKHDDQWPGWYAAYVLGRLGDFTGPSTLAHWLEEVAGGTDWFAAAAAEVAHKLGES
jgi:hypothetical protein